MRLVAVDSLDPDLLTLTQEGLDKMYGSGVVSADLFAVSHLRLRSRLEANRSDCVLFLLPPELLKSSELDPLITSTDKLVLATPEAIVGYFDSKGISVSAPQLVSHESCIQEIASLNQQIVDLTSRLNQTPPTISPDPDQEVLISSLKSQISNLKSTNLKLESELSSLKSSPSSVSQDHPLVRLAKFSTNPLGIPSEPLPEVHVVFSTDPSSADKRVYQFLQRIMEELADKGKPVVLLDLAVETVADYVFKTDLVTGSEWFLEGVNLQNSLTEITPDSSYILSMGINKFDEEQLLEIPWVTRLQELSKSYTVVVYGGCLIGLISRMLYDGFSQFTTPLVYTSGRLVSLRPALLNIAKRPHPPKIFIQTAPQDTNSAQYYQFLVVNYLCKVIDQTPERLLS